MGPLRRGARPGPRSESATAAQPAHRLRLSCADLTNMSACRATPQLQALPTQQAPVGRKLAVPRLGVP
eukprot:15469141-Alexandrium_andersonii.AAC.1